METQDVIRVNEASKTTDSPEYQQAVMVYYDRYLTRKKPSSTDMDSTFAQMAHNVYQYMCGPSEFTFTGSLKNYDRTEALKHIKVQGAGHLTMQDAPAQDLKAISDFLTDIEK